VWFDGAMVPDGVRELTDRYLAEIDRALPGFVVGLHLVGSTALGAWQPGHSDVDTIILTGRPIGAAELTAMAAVHAAMPGDTQFDGVYLDPAAYARRPMDRPVVPFVVHGELVTDRPCGELTPVMWLMVTRYGIRVRGEPVSGGVDRAALTAYNEENLREYWQPLAAQIRGDFAGVPTDLPVEPDWVVWAVLGPARLHYTIATGDILAKPDVADYIAKEFPQWTDVARRSAAHRRGETVAFTVADLFAAADHVDAVVRA
jgi:hypothetical protein